MSVIKITEHQVHHEALRFGQFGPDAYLKRLRESVTVSEKMVAAIVFLTYASGRFAKWTVNENLLQTADDLGRKLSERGITDFVVRPSRPHNCGTLYYRLDEFIAYKVMSGVEFKTVGNEIVRVK